MTTSTTIWYRLSLIAWSACLFALLASTGCRTRPLESLDLVEPDLAVPPDLTVPPDFAPPADLFVPPDFTPPPDLTRPKYCNGIYTFEDNNRFAFFDPLKSTFTPIAVLNCAQGQSPFSMGVGQDGTAWVEYTTSNIASPVNLFRVDTTTGQCTPTAFKSANGSFGHFGMGFASDGPGAATETLYLGGYDFAVPAMFPPMLGRLDLKSMVITPIGMMPGRSELTGTGGGELWAFFADDKPHVGRLDKVTAKVNPDFPLGQLGDLSGAAFAFAAFGGDFYAFVSFGAANSTVYRVHEADGALSVAVQDANRIIVGAGVSTCAPTGLDN